MKRTVRHLLVAMAIVNLSVWGCAMALAASGLQRSARATGALRGVLKDPNGLVITGLDDTQVQLKDSASGMIYSADVQVNGSFSIGDLPAGRYDLQLPMRSAMYLSYEQKDIEIAAGRTLKLDLPIQWGMNLGTIGDDPGLASNDLRRRSKYVDGPTPRTADGHPDFTGEWDYIPEKSVTFFSPVPMKPWAKAIADKLQAAMRPQNGNPGIQGPAAYCLPQSATPTALPFQFEFVQTPTRLIQLMEYLTPGQREIYLDGRPHPNPDTWNPAWYGHSVGHWEGDTLVVDSVGFNDITPGYGIHTEALHVVERITRPSVGRLVIDITATDPRAWTGPVHRHIEDGLITGEELQEWVCAENNEPSHFGGNWADLIHGLMATVPASLRQIE